MYVHQFIFPLVFVGLFSAYLMKKHWSTIVKNVNGVNNWGKIVDTEKSKITTVQPHPLESKE